MTFETKEKIHAPPAEAGFETLRVDIKQAIQGIEPQAQVLLYGSRARGDAGNDSDWDLLILVPGKVDAARKQAIRHRLYEVEWATDTVLTSMIFERELWDTPLYRAMPFHQNVERDGIRL